MRRRDRALAGLAAGLTLFAVACAIQPRPQISSVPTSPSFVSAVDSTYVSEPPVEAFWTDLGDTTLGRLVAAAMRA